MRLFFTFILCAVWVMVPVTGYAQLKDLNIDVEESAALFLEEFSDDFQESFFEALKQKGIENYDRAISALLVCKKLEPKNAVIDHELAKTYLLDGQYNRSRSYGIAALNAEPVNLWYLNTLIEVLGKQGATVNDEMENIPFDNAQLKANLALVYYKKGKYNAALGVLKNLKKSKFNEELASKINDGIKRQQQRNKRKKANVQVAVAKVNTVRDDSSQQFKTQLDSLFQSLNYTEVLAVSEKALEEYPSQPFFYYAQGWALNKTAAYKEGIEILETALDYLVDDTPLANKIYTQLAEAYNGINNSVKANMYLRKIKSGL